MAAEAALFLTHGRKGIVCIGDAYGGTLELLGQPAARCSASPPISCSGNELDRLDDLLRRRRPAGVLRNADQSHPGNVRHSAIAEHGARPRRAAGGGQHLRLAGQPAARWRSARISWCTAPPSISAATATSPPGALMGSKELLDAGVALAQEPRVRSSPPEIAALLAAQPAHAWRCGDASRTLRRRPSPRPWRGTPG